MHKHSIFFSVFFLLGTLLLLPGTATAYQGEWLIFPNLTGVHRNDSMPDHPHDVLEPTADLFFTASHERARFLAEFSLSRGENMLERFQVGWLPTPSTTLWLGRFHNPLGYWNSEFHHGSYLTTTISRPGIIAFEEHGGGVLPMHLSGLLLEGTTDTPMSYSLGVGIGPTLGMIGLTPVDILHPTAQHGRFSLSGKLNYRPQPDKMSEFGIFASHSRIPTENNFMPMLMGSTITGITQSLTGAEFNLELNSLRLIGELYIVNNRVETSAATTRHTFTSGYVQGEYSIGRKWTLFSRLEDTANASNDPYLDLTPEFIKSRTLAGTRYALGRNRALKLELSRIKHQDTSRSRQVAIEWSAVFP